MLSGWSMLVEARIVDDREGGLHDAVRLAPEGGFH
jgi:hypothetical protein